MLIDNQKYALEFANEAMYELLEVQYDSEQVERSESREN